MPSLIEYAGDFQDNALWDTHQHALFQYNLTTDSGTLLLAVAPPINSFWDQALHTALLDRVPPPSIGILDDSLEKT